jgi:hypothetical protein
MTWVFNGGSPASGLFFAGALLLLLLKAVHLHFLFYLNEIINCSFSLSD